MNKLLTLTFALTAGGALTNLSASLILVSPVELSGTGLGSVNTVLTLQSPGSSTIETGCVGVAGGVTSTTGCGFADSDIQAQFGTPTLAQAGITDAASLRVVFNAAEPGSTPDIRLNNLVLTLYGNNGANTNFALNPTGGILFPTTASGTGNSGYVFALTSTGLCNQITCPAGDTNQAATAQTFIDANGGLSGVRVGLGASAGVAAGGTGSATGGMETFFVENLSTIGGPGGGTQSAVPEPASLAMIGGGLIGLAFVRKRRK